jgi:hypothetical protein
MKRKTFFAILAILSVTVLLSLASCSKDESSSSSDSSVTENSDTVSDNVSLSSADDNTSALVSDGESNIESADDSSVESADDSSEEPTSVDMESVYWVPDEFKELEAGKAFAKINPDKGYRLDMKCTYVDDFEDESITEEGFVAQKGDNARSYVKYFENYVEDMITKDGKTYFLDHELKKFYIDDYYPASDILESVFEDYKYQKTEEQEMDGQKYIVDIFLYEDEEYPEGNFEMRIFTQNGELKCISIDDEFLKISVTYSASDDLFTIPSDYTEKTIRDSAKETFYVPDELKNTKIGKVYSTLDIDKGFSYTITNVGVDLTYMFLVKGDMACEALVNSPDDISVTTIYRDKCRYNFYYDKTYDKDEISYLFSLYEVDSLKDLIYVDTIQKTIDGVEYTAERFTDSWDSEYIFYFLGDELVGRDDQGDFEKIEIGFEVDDSLFEIPSDYDFVVIE